MQRGRGVDVSPGRPDQPRRPRGATVAEQAADIFEKAPQGSPRSGPIAASISVLQALLVDVKAQKFDSAKMGASLTHVLQMLTEAQKHVGTATVRSQEYTGKLSNIVDTRRSVSDGDKQELEVANWAATDLRVLPQKQTVAWSSHLSFSSAKEFFQKATKDVKDSRLLEDKSIKAGHVQAVVAKAKRLSEQQVLEDQLTISRILIQDPLKRHLTMLDRWDFDIFAFDETAQGHSLSVIMTHLLGELGLFTRFQVDRQIFARFILNIERGYKDVPYHNILHATDVAVNTYWFFQTKSIQEIISPASYFAGLIAAAIHDFKHPGKNNAYLVNSENELALRYNDKAVLENMHIRSIHANETSRT